MFSHTFEDYAHNSAIATIPAGLFDSINTDNVTNFAAMFIGTFRGYASSSTIATIPAELFGSIDTKNGTNFFVMFENTFSGYADNSTTATIPSGLFKNLDLSNASNVGGILFGTFEGFASANDGSGGYTTDINNIWTDGTKSANFAGKITAANASYAPGDPPGVFSYTFSGMKSLVGSAQTFINNYLGGIVPSQPAKTFNNTGVNDLAQLDPNWK
jgi:hypothetical protein